MPSNKLHATNDATMHPRCAPGPIGGHPGEWLTSGGVESLRMVGRSHLMCMSNHTIAAPITTWAEARTTDREVLNRAEVAALLTVDARTVDHAIEDGTIPAIRLGRRVLIPRRPFLAAFGVASTESA